MKKLTSLIIFCICFALLGGLFSTDAVAQQKSLDNPETTVINTSQTKNNQVNTPPPIRTPEELAYFQKAIEAAQMSSTGMVRVIVGVTSPDGIFIISQDELLQQLTPFQVRLLARYVSVPYLALEANITALVYMRDSPLVLNVRLDSVAYPSVLPERSPEETAYLYGLIQKAQANGKVRVIVRLNTNFTPEDTLTPTQLAAQRQAISLTQDEILRRLIPYQATLVIRYDSVPFLALDVDASALNLMMYSPMVLTIRENRVKVQIQKSKRKY